MDTAGSNAKPHTFAISCLPLHLGRSFYKSHLLLEQIFIDTVHQNGKCAIFDGVSAEAVGILSCSVPNKEENAVLFLSSWIKPLIRYNSPLTAL